MAGAVELVVHHPPSAVAVNPGQFFQLAVDAPHTILRRPYSAAWSDPASGRIGFIFNVVGERPAVCVAGGLGVAVFPGVVRALLARGRTVTMLQGARTAAQLLPT